MSKKVCDFPNAKSLHYYYFENMEIELLTGVGSGKTWGFPSGWRARALSVFSHAALYSHHPGGGLLSPPRESAGGHGEELFSGGVKLDIWIF